MDMQKQRVASMPVSKPFLLLGAVLVIGTNLVAPCSASSPSPLASLKPESINKTSAIVIGDFGGDNGQLVNPSIIRNEPLARKLLGEVSSSNLVYGSAYALGEYDIVFVDKKGNPIAGYIYWPAGDPPGIFMAYAVVFKEGKYYLKRPLIKDGAIMSKGNVKCLIQSVPDFEETLSKYYTFKRTL